MFNNIQINCPFKLGTNLVINSPSKSGKSECALEMIKESSNEEFKTIITVNNVSDKSLYTSKLIIIDDYDIIIGLRDGPELIKSIYDVNPNPHLIILTRGPDKNVDPIANSIRKIFKTRPCIGIVLKKNPLKYYYAFSNGDINFLGEDCLTKSSFENVTERCSNVIDILGSARNSHIIGFKGLEGGGKTLFHVPNEDLCIKLNKMFVDERDHVDNFFFSNTINESYDTIVFTDLSAISDNRHSLFEHSNNVVIFADNKNHKMIPYMFLDEN